MSTTTLDRWWPVTYDFGLIRSDIEVVAATRAQAFRDHGLEVTETWLEGTLEDCFSRLEPLAPARTRRLFVATTFGWTAFFSNGYRGSDPFIDMSQLSRALGVTSLRACVTPKSALYQGVILEVYDTPQAGADEYGYRRSICAVNDGGRWVFAQSGTPYPFEDLSRYEVRLKRDRFTADMLARYLEHLGVPRLRDETLEPNGRCRAFLLARPTHGHLPSYSLEEAKALNERRH